MTSSPLSTPSHTRARARHSLWAVLPLSALLLNTLGCTPKVVRSAPPQAPTSAIEMAGDTDRLDQVIAAGQLKKDELKRTREVYARSLEELKDRQSRDEGLQQLAIKRIELTIQLYDNLLTLSEQPVNSRSDRSELAVKAYAFEREYLRKLMEFEQGIELLPQTISIVAPTEGSGPLKVESLPPPPSSRLLAAYRAGRYEQVTREVEGSGPDALTRMPPTSITAYALALGAIHRYEEADAAARLVEKEALLPEEQLELRYRQGLWLLKLGKRDEAVAILKNLSQDTVVTAKRLDDMRPRLSATFEDLGRGNPHFQEQIIEARLALEEDRWEDARSICRGLLEKETTVETVNRVEALLRQIDADEERAFRSDYDELVTVIDIERGSAAEEAINKLAQRYPRPVHQNRIQLLRSQLAERTKAREAAEAAAAGGGDSPAPAPVAPATTPGGAAPGTGSGTPSGTVPSPGSTAPSTGSLPKEASGQTSALASGAAAALGGSSTGSSTPQTGASTGVTGSTGASTGSGTSPAGSSPGGATGAASPMSSSGSGAAPASGSTGAASGAGNSSSAAPHPTSTPVAPSATGAGNKTTPQDKPVASSAAPDLTPKVTGTLPSSTVPTSTSSATTAAATSSGTPGSVQTATSTRPDAGAASTRPAETAKPGDPSKSADTSKPGDASKPGDTSKPADASKSGDTSKPADASKPADSARPTVALTPDAQQKILNDARAQGKSGNFEGAIELYRQLEGTALAAAAADEGQRMVDMHIQKVRERVARDFVQASSLPKEEKSRRLQSLYDVLKESLDKYPSTTLRAKVEQNMRVLEQELKKLSQG